VPNSSDFYCKRDLRTTEYMRNHPFEILPVHVGIDSAAASEPAGQLALLALANQLARVHRHVTFDLPSSNISLRIRNLFAQPTLSATLLAMCSRIDPCGDFRMGLPPSRRTISIGLGSNPPGKYEWYIGAHQAVAHLGRSPIGFSSKAATLRGAALSSCLGAAALFRSMVGLETIPRSVSAWNYAEGTDAALGPESLTGLDVGRVLMVGAGAVGASLVYWLNAFGVCGTWTIIDYDVIEVHNLNRGLIFTAADAGWPEGEPQGKAQILSSLLPDARWEPEWYDKSKFVQEDYDVILGLANDRNVRHFIASRNSTITLHATTGENWLSQVHRHIAGVDDCIWCRAGEFTQPNFKCSTGGVELPSGAKTDAALPFLSAASGLMLATALQQLECGELAKQDRNDWRWDFASTHKMASSGFRRCRTECTRVSPLSVRQKIDKTNRWLYLGS
jgi:ThiF family